MITYTPPEKFKETIMKMDLDKIYSEEDMRLKILLGWIDDCPGVRISTLAEIYKRNFRKLYPTDDLGRWEVCVESSKDFITAIGGSPTISEFLGCSRATCRTWIGSKNGIPRKYEDAFNVYYEDVKSTSNIDYYFLDVNGDKHEIISAFNFIYKEEKGVKQW